jgi:LysM repeat protein
MKNPIWTKHLAVLFASVALASGCASTSEEAPPPSQPAAAAPAPAAPAAAAPAPAAAGQYTVIRGDNLWDISAKPSIYGNPYEWPLIYKANSDQIKDADLIYPGQVLAIDANPSATDVDAAIRHARTRGSWSLGVVEESDKAYLAR